MNYDNKIYYPILGGYLYLEFIFMHLLCYKPLEILVYVCKCQVNTKLKFYEQPSYVMGTPQTSMME